MHRRGEGSVRRVGTISLLAWREARRRKILWLGLILGTVFVGVFTLGFYYTYIDYIGGSAQVRRSSLQIELFPISFITAGLYVVNFMVVMVTVLTAVGAISTEVETAAIHAVAAKPILRWEIVLGKWLGHAAIVALYTSLLVFGVVTPVLLISGYLPAHVVGILAVMVLEGLVVLSLTIAGSAQLSTLANGVMVFMLYSIAFVGGWVEQIGAMSNSQTAQDLGTASSLLMPSEGLWKYASSLMQHHGLRTLQSQLGPFALAIQPTPAFVAYAIVYTIALLIVAIVLFERRDL